MQSKKIPKNPIVRHLLVCLLCVPFGILIDTATSSASIFDKLIKVEDDRMAASKNASSLRNELPAIDSELADLAKKSDTATRASKPVKLDIEKTLIRWEKVARRLKRASSVHPERRKRVLPLMKTAFSTSIPKKLGKLKVLEKAVKQIGEFHQLMHQRTRKTVLLGIESSIVAAKESERTALLKGSKNDPQVIKDLEETAKKLAQKTKALRNSKDNTDFHRRMGTLRPPISTPVTYPFGPRQLSKLVTIRHTGQTWVVDNNTPVLATAPGKVIFRESFPGYGNVIIIDHGGGYTSLYAHLSSFEIPLGFNVSRGTEIAKSGDSGSLDGPKLYFELRENGIPVDPQPWYLFH